MRAWCFRGIGLLSPLLVLFAAEPPLPAAPDGFTWARLAEIRADLLKPKGWNLTRKRKGDSETYRMTGPKSGAGAGSALDINWVGDVPGKAKMKPTQYVATLISAAGNSHKLLERSSGTLGSLATASFRYQDSGSGRDSVMVRYQFFANDQTGSLYIAAFEARAQEWTNSWNTGRVLMENFRVDPSF